MEENTKPALNLLYCGDHRSMRGFYLSLLSIQKRTERALNVILFTMSVPELGFKGQPLDEEDAMLLKKMLNSFNPASDVKVINLTDRYEATIKTGKNNKTQYTPYTMARLFADDVLTDIDRIIYIDNDTMGVGDISSFEDYPLEDYEMGVVPDWLSVRFGHPHYFNAGVLYINLSKVRQTGLFKKALDMCLNKKMLMPDQDALNRSIQLKLELPEKFNDQRFIHSDTVIEHYPKRFWTHFHPVKPWMIAKMHKKLHTYAFDEDYDFYLKNFPFEKYGFKDKLN